MSNSIETELKAILSHYTLGELVDFEKNERGFVNTAFAIEMLAETPAGLQRRRYFLRKYKRGIGEQELRFEHSLIERLVAVQACPVAHLHKTRQGKTYLHQFEGSDDQQGVFYAIFDYLPGDDRFTWVDPILSPAELSASAVILAQLHNALAHFQPDGQRLEPKIRELLPVIAQTWAECPAKSKGSIFDDYLLKNFALVQANIQATQAALSAPQVDSLPEIVIHCDFHPGNLKFSGEAVTGLFDFDWSKVDLRLFDLALALWYFCTSWQSADDGRLRLDWLRTILITYQDHLRRHPGMGPISALEASLLPVMVNASNLYVLNWTILDYYAKDVDPQEYLLFLAHSINFIRWYEQAPNRQALEQIALSALRPD
jgi:homoserine kinase type II